MLRFLVAIPVFNECRHLRGVLGAVRRYGADLLVVDDGSTDGTTELLRRESGIHKVFHPENRGYGQALISAFQHAVERRYDWLVTLDCDQQHEPAVLPQFFAAARRDDADIVSGSRYLRVLPSGSHPPADRRRINHRITCLLNELLGLELTDAFCGFKAYRVASLAALALDIPGYAMPLQLWVQAACRGLRIRELAVRLIYNDPTRHFGGLLDDPQARLEHYLSVLAGELVRSGRIGAPEELERRGALACP